MWGHGTVQGAVAIWSIMGARASKGNQVATAPCTVVLYKMAISSPQPKIETTPNVAARRGERYFLEGPKSRGSEAMTLWRVLREFFYGFRKLHFIGPCVTVFGSARFHEDHRYYELARGV